MRLRALLPLLALSLLCLGFGKKNPPLTIRFYTQTSKQDTDSFSAPITMLNGEQTTVDQVAAIAERDIVAIYPFQAADGSIGCGLKLDPHGTMALDSLSTDKRGTILIATINGRQVADIYVDARVSDGVVTIPAGLQPAEMQQMLKKYPVLGAPAKKGAKGKSKYDEGF